MPSPPAHTQLFGFKPTPARVEVIARPTSWRASHALVSLAIGWGLIPVVMFVPPHVPWVLAGFFGGIYFAIHYWRERYTLVALETTCPKCGSPLRQEKPTRLALPHRLHCDSCQQNPILEVDVRGLAPGGATAEGAPPVPPAARDELDEPPADDEPPEARPA